MTVAEFKKKWLRYQGKETSAYQEHFNDLCHLLGLPTPAEADPTGSDWFCFQKRVVKDLELYAVEPDGSEAPKEKRGFADVWRKDAFAWEYKGKHKDLDEAYRQLQRYRESLLNPPLLVVCDFENFIIRTNFNGTVQEVHDFHLTRIDDPKNWRILRALFTDPESLRPVRTTAEVTEALARHIAEIAKSLQKREAVELADAKTRAEMNFAQRKNLRIARFLNRLVFCFFAEDTGLLPPDLFSNLLKGGLDDPHHLATTMENLFAVMATGGTFGKDKIRHFNGHLFEEATVFELTDDELKLLAEAGEYSWQFIQPSIMGTLFERALEPEQRSQLGAHYTSEADIKTLVEPVLMAPLRREWSALKRTLAHAYAKGKGTPAQRDELAAFQKQLADTTVLDPACGSGNFLYVSLQLLLALEKEVLAYATQLGFKLAPKVGVSQLRAIEINPYAYELAQVSVQIGYLQWRRDNGFENDRTPVLQNLDGFHNEDALLEPHFGRKPRNLKEARADEHTVDTNLKFYTEREWPKCDVIVGNPPWKGGKLLRRMLGDDYVVALFSTFDHRVEPQADLCCYWFEKARKQIEKKECRRVGLLGTQAIRGGANREVLKRIKETGDIFFAVSDRDWVLDGANVHTSLVGFDDGSETSRQLDGSAVAQIHSNLTSQPGDTTLAQRLPSMADIAFMGDTKGGSFDIDDSTAQSWLLAPNPSGRPNSDVLVPWANGLAVTRRLAPMWIVDFGMGKKESWCAQYKAPFAHALTVVKPERAKSRTTVGTWWQHERARPDLHAALSPLPRFLVMPRVAKHQLFVWMQRPLLPDSAVFAFADSGDALFGFLHSRHHRIWAGKQGTQVRERESGFRYTPTTCFETFPFPFALKDPLPQGESTPQSEAASAHHFFAKEPAAPYGEAAHRAAIAAAAKELNDLRERWLNPPEWTKTVTLEFPGSVGGPWSRFIDTTTVNAAGVGTVRYPRLEPRNEKCAAELKKRTLTALYNERPAWLDHAHQKLDAAVAAAYGWPADLSDEQILERLLALNLSRAAAETAATAKPKTRKPQREKSDDELI
ncbi:MAG: class I SAM-dependent DNA methyltransferase [Candidatus Didemnitutus sp.]|nr:class I SAM-dependent DNA methyltransferase [Candidatus Didemnitutus sp.]